MKIYADGGGVVLTEVENFDIKQILECGQCFRFECLSEGHYKIIALGKALSILQEAGDIVLSPCTVEEFNEVWNRYFDINRDYAAIQTAIVKNDSIMEAAVEYAPGIRILNQEFWEAMVSFIISQNNHIPRIKTLIESISQVYGTPIDGGFAFPKASEMAAASTDDLYSLKTGFRAKYIKDAVDKALAGQLDESQLQTLEIPELRKKLTTVYGIGNKVADCIMLFGMGRGGVFPADVWIKRIVSKLYFGGKDLPLKELQVFAQDKWGENAGLAQQYLFHYARRQKLGK